MYYKGRVLFRLVFSRVTRVEININVMYGKKNDRNNNRKKKDCVVLFVQISNTQQKLITNNEYDLILSLREIK